MLHAKCCEKGVHRWVPRRSGAPGSIARSAEHANEVIMLCLLLASAPPLQCGLRLSWEAGHPRDAANHRCHIWHNEQNTRVSPYQPALKSREVFYSAHAIKPALAICIRNKVSLSGSTERHSFANCSCCVFIQESHSVVFSPILFMLMLLFTAEEEGGGG